MHFDVLADSAADGGGVLWGADSTCLAHLAKVFAESTGNPAPLLLHVEHGLRPESKDEAQTLQDWCEERDWRLCVEEVSVPREASLEAAARKVRYRAFREFAEREGLAAVLTAHTRSDQAETLLLRMMRGTGVAGMAGIPERRGLYHRPLLNWSAADTRRYCEQHKLSYLRDTMNDDARFARVRVRKHLLPLLAEENPNIEEALAKLARSAAENRELLDWLAESRLRAWNVGESFSVGQEFLQSPPALQKHLLRLWLQRKYGVRLQATHFEAALGLCANIQGSASLDFPGGQLWLEYGELRWSPKNAQTLRPHLPGCHFRTWQAGDRMRPLRLCGRSRKLSDLFADAKISRRLRATAEVATHPHERSHRVGTACGVCVRI